MDFKWESYGKANDVISVLKYIMKQHDFTSEQMKKFIYERQEPHNPFLFKNMKLVTERIKKAIKNNEIIMIIGDYDCDGITATYTLYRGLKELGANVLYKLPHRLYDGYGLKNKLVDYAKENNTNLIITVDNGITAVDAVDYAKELGMDIIITDHHEPQEKLPDCLILDPKVNKEYPFDGLCGCGVAFKVVCALYGNDFYNSDLYNQLIEIVAIGTIADVMQIIDENRTFVINGLKNLSNSNNFGIRELFKLTDNYKKEITVDTIGFLLGPNINACGRLESPDIAMKFLLCDDEITAKEYAKQMLKINEKRKELQNTILNELNIDEKDKIIVNIIDSKYAGIGGIIASNIVDKYHKPCFIFHGNEESEVYGGSGRTFGDFNIMSCIINNPQLIISGGGHLGACGVAVSKDNYNNFKIACQKEYLEFINKNPNYMMATLHCTCEIDFNLITNKLYKNISMLKPFGEGNPMPTFYTNNVNVISHRTVGKNKNVKQFVLENNNIEFKAVGFKNLKEKFEELGEPEKISILYSIDINEWPQGVFNLQLILIDIKK